MLIMVKFFSTFKAITGVDGLTIDIPEGSSVDELFKILCNKFGNIHLDLANSMIIVNKTISPRERILKDGDTVMFLHLMGGG